MPWRHKLNSIPLHDVIFKLPLTYLIIENVRIWFRKLPQLDCNGLDQIVSSSKCSVVQESNFFISSVDADFRRFIRHDQVFVEKILEQFRRKMLLHVDAKSERPNLGLRHLDFVFDATGTLCRICRAKFNSSVEFVEQNSRTMLKGWEFSSIQKIFRNSQNDPS